MVTHIYYPCIICRGRAWSEAVNHFDPQPIHCMRCGDYVQTRYFRAAFKDADLTDQQRANISGYVRENPGIEINADRIPFLLTLRTPTVAEKAHKLLRYISTRIPLSGQRYSIGENQIDGQIGLMSTAIKGENGSFAPDPANEEVCQKQLPLLSASWTSEGIEVDYLLNTYLPAIGVLSLSREGFLQISPKGWEIIQSRKLSEGSVCFVAMAFAKEFDALWNGPIYRGITNAGYQPFRVDAKEHNDSINDEIVAGIRTSKFMLADFTRQRNGVYWEAGFAVGLGKEVIKTVREDEIGELHFDTRQNNHISWTADSFDAFEKAITRRIVATVGQGPIAVLDDGILQS